MKGTHHIERMLPVMLLVLYFFSDAGMIGPSRICWGIEGSDHVMNGEKRGWDLGGSHT